MTVAAQTVGGQARRHQNTPAKQGMKSSMPSARKCGADSMHNKKPKEMTIMTLNVKPIGDRILVEAVEEKELKKGGIIIPDTAKEKPMESRIVALGTGRTDDNGKKVPFEMKKGDRVLVTKYGGTEIKLEGKEFKILNSEDVLAVLE